MFDLIDVTVGRVAQPGPAARGGRDLIGALGRQRLPAARALEHHEDPISAGISRPFSVQVGSDRREEPARHRDQPLPAAFPLGDEHPPLGGAQVFQPQPEDLAAGLPAQHYGRDHFRTKPAGAPIGQI